MTGLVDRWWLILIVLVVVLIIWGPGKLPDVGAGLGRAIKEFRKASTETKETIINATSTSPQPSSPAPATPVQQPTAPGSADQKPSEVPSEQSPVSS